MNSKQEQEALLAAFAAGPQDNLTATSVNSIPELVVTPCDPRSYLTSPHHQSSASLKKTAIIQMATHAILQKNKSVLTQLFEERRATVTSVRPTYALKEPHRLSKLSQSASQRIATSDSSFRFTQAQQQSIQLMLDDPNVHTARLSEQKKKDLPTLEGRKRSANPIF